MKIKCKKHNKKLILHKLNVLGKKKRIWACPDCFKPRINLSSLLQVVRE